MTLRLTLILLVTLTLSGCGLDWERLSRASLAGMDGVNDYHKAHPPLVLPPSQCYGCGHAPYGGRY